jgi:hypothetical protein
MHGPYWRKYGEAATFNFVLFATDGIDFAAAVTHQAGDTTIMKDEEAEANTTNGFVDEGNGYSLSLTATEMEAARIVIYVVDQGTKAWLDTALLIETYGHASAQHEFDLDSAGAALSTAAIADAVWDEALADHDTEDTVGNVFNDLVEESSDIYIFTSGALANAPTAGYGAGAITFTYTLTSTVDASPIPDANVWVTTGIDGSGIVASGVTNISGQCTFYLDAGTYYVWRQKAGWNFSNPDTETVS